MRSCSFLELFVNRFNFREEENRGTRYRSAKKGTCFERGPLRIWFVLYIDGEYRVAWELNRLRKKNCRDGVRFPLSNILFFHNDL